jgi:nucleoside-diphosphate-sugar epimerase
MNENTKKYVILGSGQLGQAVLRVLLQRGAENICLVNRSGKAPAGLPAQAASAVQFTAADLYQPEEVRRVTRDADVVFHTANPLYKEWQQKFPPLQASLIEGMSGSTAPLVMGDNLYMYGPVTGPISEDLPYAARNRKGSTRAQTAEMLLEAHRQGRLRAVMGRGSDFFGPAVTNSTLGDPIFGALAKGKPANVLGKPDLPHTYTYIDDFAQALIVLGEHEEAWGQAWHVPNAETITTRQLVHMAAEELGVEPKMVVAGPLMMRVLSLFVPSLRELIEMDYAFTQPYIVDDSKYKQTFGDHSTPLREAIRQTAAWYKSQ